MKTTSTNAFTKAVCIVAVLFLLSTQIIQAQNWPQPGATWEYCYETMTKPVPNGTLTFAYTGDTIIQDLNYAIISKTFYNTTPYVGGSQPENSIYVRTSNDTIYRYVAGTEYILFVNGLEIGDSFTTFRTSVSYDQYSCQELMNLEVIDIVENVISGVTLRYVYMLDADFANIYDLAEWVNNGEGMYHLFIENVGFGGSYNPVQSGDMAYSYGVLASECSLASDGSSNTLNKYLDHQSLLDFGQCLSVSVNEISETSVSFHPNPSSDYVYIELKQLVSSPISYTVFDISGRIVQSGSITNTAQPGFDVQTLPFGSYLVNIQSMDQRFVSRFVKN